VASFVRIDVSPEVLEWALDKSGKRAQLQRQFRMLDKWLDGEVKPTLRQLEDFAKKTYVPLGVLFLRHPPREELPIANFRTFGDAIFGWEEVVCLIWPTSSLLMTLSKRPVTE
jgi:hypothetical protein